MAQFIIFAGLILFGQIPAVAQSPVSNATFDVASVKVAKGDPSPSGYTHQITPLGLTASHVSLGYCIRLAFGVERSYELIGPDWIDPPTQNLFDVIARVEKPATADQIKVMLQALLRDRFQLVIHSEERDLPAYALLLGPRPPTVTASGDLTPTSVKPDRRPQNLRFEHVSMAQLAMQLGYMTSRPVTDKTGLAGNFDFSLELAPYVIDQVTGKLSADERGAVDTEHATIAALRDELGLILKPVRAPVQVRIVDHVNKIPTPD